VAVEFVELEGRSLSIQSIKKKEEKKKKKKKQKIKPRREKEECADRLFDIDLKKKRGAFPGVPRGGKKRTRYLQVFLTSWENSVKGIFAKILSSSGCFHREGG